MMFNVQVGEIEENTMVGIYTDDPGTVHIIGITAGIQRRMDFPWWSSDWAPTTCIKRQFIKGYGEFDHSDPCHIVSQYI